jgi:hypothetical protein
VNAAAISGNCGVGVNRTLAEFAPAAPVATLPSSSPPCWDFEFAREEQSAARES